MAINNSALIFPANAANYVTINNTASIKNLSEFTFMAWFKVGPASISAPGQSAYVERQGAGTGIRFRFTPVKGKLQFGLACRDTGLETSYTHNTKWDDRWHHAAFTAKISAESPTYQIFLDGFMVSEGTLVKGNATIEKIPDTLPLGIYVGNHVRSGTAVSTATAWNGNIDEIIILKEAMSQSRISEYLESKDDWKLEPNTLDEDQPLLYYWRFDEYAGTATKDSRSNKTATLPATARWSKDRPFLGNGANDTAAPTRPLMLANVSPTHTITSDQFTGRWAASTDNIYVQFYELQVSEYSNFSSYTAHDVGTKTTHTVKGLLPGVNYYWRVRAFDAARNASPYSTTQAFTTPMVGDNSPPHPPTSVAASYLTHSSFRITFTASKSTDVLGYKIDIAEDSLFDRYIPGYKNLDLGNNLLVDVGGLESNKAYYVRLRAYDVFDNESLESTVITPRTLAAPDITPPQEVELDEVTSLSAKTATLNWEEGVDDTGVTGYSIDVATDPAFKKPAITPTQVWQNVEIGNVTSLRLSGLTEETQYYWRVRAFDRAGNISSYQEVPGEFRTLPSTIYEAGNTVITAMPASMSSATSIATHTENIVYEDLSLPLTATSKVFLILDTFGVVGTPEAIAFNFIPKLNLTDPSNHEGTLQIKVYPYGDPQATYESQGRSLSYRVLSQAAEHEVDILTLFDLAHFGKEYVVELSTLGTESSFVGYIDTGMDNALYQESPQSAPFFDITSDPNTSTQALELIDRMVSQERFNLQANPTFEVNTNGWIGVGGAQITVSDSADAGSMSCRVTGSALGSGLSNQATAASLPLVTVGQTYTVTFSTKRVSGVANFKASLIAVDSTGLNPVVISTKSYTLLDEATDTTKVFQRVSLSGVIPPNKARLRLEIVSETAGAYVFHVDNVLVEDSFTSGAAFSGTSAGARWTGVTNASISSIVGSEYVIESPYIGDSNNNNKATAYFRNSLDDEGWFETKTATAVNRVEKRYVSTIAPSYGAINLVKNPSFELNSLYWSGGSRVDTHQASGDYSYLTPANIWAIYTPHILVEPNTDYTVQAMVLSDAGQVVTNAALKSVNSAGALTLERNLVSEPEYGSLEVWTKVIYQFKTGPTERYLRLAFKSTMQMWIDAVQVTATSVVPPYRDGSILDGVWEGNPHASTSGINIQARDTYVTSFVYEDPEGFFEASAGTTLDVRGSFEVPPAPDNVTTVYPLKLTATENRINVMAPYEGDDNENNVATVRYRRTDKTQWNDAPVSYVRKEKYVKAIIAGLAPGTSYTIDVKFTDDDGVAGAGALGNVTGKITTDYAAISTEGKISITFGGVELMGTNTDEIGVTSHNAFGLPDRRVELDDLPRSDGAIERQAFWGAREITMEGYISASSRPKLEGIRTALARALAPRTQRLVINTLSRANRYYFATCRSLDITEDSKNISHLRWEAVFVCADPFAYDAVEKVVNNLSVPKGKGFSQTNAGDVSVHPTMILTTTSAYPVMVSIVNNTTGEVIRPKTAFVRGDRIEINGERKSLLRNGVEIDYVGAFPRMVPGENKFTFEANATSGSPILDVSLRWRARYL